MFPAGSTGGDRFADLSPRTAGRTLIPMPWDEPKMNLSDRRLACFAAGLLLLGSASGCRSARYQTATNATESTTYGGTAVTPSTPPLREPPSAFGPREPIPVSPSVEPSGRATYEPVPEDSPSARTFDLGPALQAVPEDSPVDEDLKFPEANRRGKGGRSLRARLTAARKKGAEPTRTPVEMTGNTTQGHKGSRNSQDRATAKLVQHSDSPAPSRGKVESADLQPVLIADPPSLVAPPVTREAVRNVDRHDLAIERIALCSEVRDYDDVLQVDPQRLERQAPLLVYASLQNFRSRASQNGFQTLTRSQVELRTLSGEVVWRQALGTATDVSPKPRHQYYLAHELAIPANIAPGNYVLSLRIEDVLSEQAATAQVAVRVHGGS